MPAARWGALWREARLLAKGRRGTIPQPAAGHGDGFSLARWPVVEFELGGLFKRSIRARCCAGAVVRAVPKNSPYWSLGAEITSFSPDKSPPFNSSSESLQPTAGA